MELKALKGSNFVRNPKEKFLIRLKKDFKRYKYIYLMLLPVLLYYIVFNYLPMAGSVIAFQDFKPAKGFFDSKWVGLKHFVEFFTGPYAWRVIYNTLKLNVLDLLFSFPAPIILALLIEEVKNLKFKKVVQTVSYMPHFISMVVMCGMIVTFVKSDGIITNLLVSLGMEKTNLLSVSKFFPTIYVSSSVWKTIGWGSIIYLSSLSGIDQNMYEAAVIDGANRFKQILYVTLPALIPIITVQFILRTGTLLSQGFEKVLLLYNPLIYDSADIISTFVYRRGLEDMSYSFASAVGIFNSVVNLILLITANKISKKITQESLW